MPRARDLGIVHRVPAPTGRTNSVLDVPGVGLGHTTLHRDQPSPPDGRGASPAPASPSSCWPTTRSRGRCPPAEPCSTAPVSAPADLRPHPALEVAAQCLWRRRLRRRRTCPACKSRPGRGRGTARRAPAPVPRRPQVLVFCRDVSTGMPVVPWRTSARSGPSGTRKNIRTPLLSVRFRSQIERLNGRRRYDHPRRRPRRPSRAAAASRCNCPTGAGRAPRRARHSAISRCIAGSASA